MNRVAGSVMVRVVLIAATILVAETFTAAVGDESTGHFSQRQISSYMKTVTSQLALSKNWKSDLGSNINGKLKCNSVVLGEGMRAGNHGLYTWFTCSAMHKLETANMSTSSLACTGFSSPVWIEPIEGRITYQTVSSGSEYSNFRVSVPEGIQSVMDSNFQQQQQLNASQSRVLISRAVQGAATASPSGTSTSCQ